MNQSRLSCKRHISIDYWEAQNQFSSPWSQNYSKIKVMMILTSPNARPLLRVAAADFTMSVNTFCRAAGWRNRLRKSHILQHHQSVVFLFFYQTAALNSSLTEDERNNSVFMQIMTTFIRFNCSVQCILRCWSVSAVSSPSAAVKPLSTSHLLVKIYRHFLFKSRKSAAFPGTAGYFLPQQHQPPPCLVVMRSLQRKKKQVPLPLFSECTYFCKY